MREIPEAWRGRPDLPRSRRLLLWAMDTATIAWTLASIGFGGLGAFTFCIIVLKLGRNDATYGGLVFAILGGLVLVHLMPTWREGIRRKYPKQDRAGDAL